MVSTGSILQIKPQLGWHLGFHYAKSRTSVRLEHAVLNDRHNPISALSYRLATYWKCEDSIIQLVVCA